MWLSPLHTVFCFAIRLAEMKNAWRLLKCDGLCVTLSCPVFSDLPCDGVALGALHAAPFPAPAHWMALLPSQRREDQLQPGPSE